MRGGQTSDANGKGIAVAARGEPIPEESRFTIPVFARADTLVELFQFHESVITVPNSNLMRPSLDSAVCMNEREHAVVAD